MDEESDEDHRSRSDGSSQDRDELGRLARGIDGIGRAYDTSKQSDFMKHANESLHSLISRRGTLLEHNAADSGPPTSSGLYPQGHIFASNLNSATDYADIDILKPPRNAHDEYLAQQRRLFPSPEEQARRNDEAIRNMHNWMDELLDVQEGIATLHMKLEGVEGEDGDGEFKLKDKLDGRDVPGETKRDDARTRDAEKANDGKDESKPREEEERKREDAIMDEMIQEVSLRTGLHLDIRLECLLINSCVATRTVQQTPAIPRNSAPNNHIRHVEAYGETIRPATGRCPHQQRQQTASDSLGAQERFTGEEYTIAPEADLPGGRNESSRNQPCRGRWDRTRRNKSCRLRPSTGVPASETASRLRQGGRPTQRTAKRIARGFPTSERRTTTTCRKSTGRGKDFVPAETHQVSSKSTPRSYRPAAARVASTRPQAPRQSRISYHA